MTTEQYFRELLHAISVTRTEHNRMAKKHARLRENLRKRINVEEDFLSGSYTRKTLIRSWDNIYKIDVDFYIVFKKNDFESLEFQDLFEAVTSTLYEIKKTDEDIEEIIEQRSSICVIYDNFRIDVIPAIQIENVNRYQLFDAVSQLAFETNPKNHDEVLALANEATASGSTKRLVPMIKLLKAWRRAKCDYLRKYHLEMLAIAALGNEEIGSFSQGLAKFFCDVSLHLDRESWKDLAKKDRLINSYLVDEGNKDNILELMNFEKETAREALYLEEQGNDDEAVKKWRLIFGAIETGYRNA